MQGWGVPSWTSHRGAHSRMRLFLQLELCTFSSRKEKEILVLVTKSTWAIFRAKRMKSGTVLANI